MARTAEMLRRERHELFKARKRGELGLGELADALTRNYRELDQMEVDAQIEYARREMIKCQATAIGWASR